jgi:hypothetical protein
MIAAARAHGDQWVLLLVSGSPACGTGVAIWLPLSLFGTLVWLVGRYCGTGVIKLVQLARRAHARRDERGP